MRTLYCTDLRMFCGCLLPRTRFVQVADFFEHAEMRRPTVHGLVVLQLSTGGDVHVLLGLGQTQRSGRHD